MAYTPKLKTHDSKQIKIAIEFDDPEQMSIGGVAELGMDIKQPSVFKSAKDLKSMSKDSFDKGKPKLKGEVPPMTSNPDQAKKIKQSKSFGDVIQYLSSSNFFIGLILGGCM